MARPTLNHKEFPDGDWPIMEFLLFSAGVVQAQPGGAKPARRALLQLLRQHVATCLQNEDETLLKRLYQRLFELDTPISAALALELKLIDAINDVTACGQQKRLSDQLCIPEWAPLFRPHGRVHRHTLCRHTLVLGETGSGKTVSGILPVVGSIMAPENWVGCTLVIDPKREIRDTIKQLQHPGVVVHDIDVEQAERRPVLNLMAGDNLSLASTLADDQFAEAARQILIRSASLSPMGAARAMTDGKVADRDIYWAGEGARLAQSALGLALLIIQYRQRIYGDDEAPGLITDGEHETQSLLVEFGMEAGFLNVCEDVTALVKRTKRELCNIGHLWREAERQKKHEEQLEEEDEDRRFGRRYESEREQVETHALGEFVKVKRILVPATVAQLKDSKAGQRDNGETLGQPATKVRARTLDKRWQDALAPVMQRFAEAGRETALYLASPRFRDRFEENIAAAAKHTNFERIRDEVLANIQQAALHLLDDESICPAPNILALAQTVLQSFFKATKREREKNIKSSNLEDLPAMWLVELLRDKIHSGQAEAIYQVIEQSWNPMGRSASHGQYIGVFGYGKTCFTEFADKTPAWTLYFGCEPYYESVVEHGRDDILPLDFSSDVDAKDRRAVYVFQPRLDMNEAIVAKALKAAYFEAVLANRRRQQNGQTMPLVGYVADECHRFITSDRQHGEQSFLDTCRSFGAFCVLACQSIASLEHALAGMDNNETLNRAAVSILLNNTGNKLFFRSTDQSLHERVDQLCPGGGFLGKPTYVRPLSTLNPGECYASLSDGRFERRQLLPFKTVKDSASRKAARMRA